MPGSDEKQPLLNNREERNDYSADGNIGKWRGAAPMPGPHFYLRSIFSAGAKNVISRRSA